MGILPLLSVRPEETAKVIVVKNVDLPTHLMLSRKKKSFFSF